MKCNECQWKKKCRSQCRQLAEGQNCGQCARLEWCQAMYGITPGNTLCVVAPPKFEQKGGEQDE